MKKYIEYKGGYKYQLAEKYCVAIPFYAADFAHEYFNFWDGYLTINKGYCWDGPSGPTFDTDNFMRGSLVHDCLYQAMRQDLLDIGHRKDVDRLLYKHCIEDGMFKLRAKWVYAGVRAGGKDSATRPRETYYAPKKKHHER
jgi:hypothetical protein